jgi:riboflavin synthase
MFTGIITDIGEVLSLDPRGDLGVRIGTAYDVARIDIGASIACDGVCLTVVRTGTELRNWIEVQISAETLSKTNLGTWAPGVR